MANQKDGEIWKLTLAAVLSLAILGIAARLLIPSGTISLLQKQTSNRVLETKSLTVGIRTSPDSYTPLAEYLRKAFNNQVQVVIDGDGNLSQQDAKNRIAAKKWDIAFPLSPMLSIAAKDNGYSFAARSSTTGEPYYKSALFVRYDSPIKSLEDLQPTTTVALGEFNSSSSFYVPVYDLYGKSLRIDMGHKHSEIIEMVETGKADAGASIFNVVKDNPKLRIIHISRNIPSSGGVYLSPKLSDSDRAAIKQVLLSAPSDIQKKASYEDGKELDFTHFIGISRRVEEVLACANFSKNPVNFFCPGRERSVVDAKGNAIGGIVNGFSYANADTIHLTLSGDDGQVYRVVLPRQILNQVSNAPPPPGLIDKKIQVIGVTPISAGGTLELQITQANQLKVL
jgi:serine/threonine-protein kinase